MMDTRKVNQKTANEKSGASKAISKSIPAEPDRLLSMTSVKNWALSGGDEPDGFVSGYKSAMAQACDECGKTAWLPEFISCDMNPEDSLTGEYYKFTCINCRHVKYSDRYEPAEKRCAGE